MGNSLLDFVMSLVRDPEAAARYAADPAGALSAAGLPGVTITDVQNLIPVVTDSLAAATPAFGGTPGADNVWSGSAAAAALDAFHVPHPAPVVHEPSVQVEVPRIDVGPVESTPVADDPLADAPAVITGGGLLEQPLPEPVGAGDDGWLPPPDVQPEHPVADHHGFDLF